MPTAASPGEAPQRNVRPRSPRDAAGQLSARRGCRALAADAAAAERWLGPRAGLVQKLSIHESPYHKDLPVGRLVASALRVLGPGEHELQPQGLLPPACACAYREAPAALHCRRGGRLSAGMQAWRCYMYMPASAHSTQTQACWPAARACATSP